MVFQLRRKILSTRSHHETSPDEEGNDSVLLNSHTHSRERDEESCRADEQVEDAGIIWLQHGIYEILYLYLAWSNNVVGLMGCITVEANIFLHSLYILVNFPFVN
jgi:hypothetical protein